MSEMILLVHLQPYWWLRSEITKYATNRAGFKEPHLEIPVHERRPWEWLCKCLLLMHKLNMFYVTTEIMGGEDSVLFKKPSQAG